MALQDIRRKLPFGMGTVAVIGSALLVLTGGLVLWGSPTTPYEAADGALRSYPVEPPTAWTLEDTDLPDYTGADPIRVEDRHGDDWLLSYPSGVGRSYLMVDAGTGEHRWPEPVRAGLGDCAIDGDGQTGCAIKLGTVPDGFYLVGPEGALPSKPSSDLLDTTRVISAGPAAPKNFLRVNQVGYQLTMRDERGGEVWSRTFAAAATPRMTDGMLVVSTADGASYILDPATGADQLTCTDCQIQVYPDGALVVDNTFDDEGVTVHSREGGRLGPSVRTAKGLGTVDGRSALPVLTGVGAGQMMASDGKYEVIDPATGEALWQITDPELSKANTRPCGDVVAMARKNRSRVFFNLADGKRLGEIPPPALDQRDSNLDYLGCVGASGDTAVFFNRNQLTAYDTPTGKVAWTQPISGTAQALDGYIVLTQGTSLSVLRPRSS